jgi:hypothetical protein
MITLLLATVIFVGPWAFVCWAVNTFYYKPRERAERIEADYQEVVRLISQ